MADPKFVRLAEHLARGGRYDINSGFGISGYDVVPMPDKEEQPRAYKYVKGEMAAGRIEGASKAEYDEAHPDILATLGHKSPGEVEEARPVQEREVQTLVRSVHRKVKARRTDEGQADAFEADQKRREATLAAQKAREDRTTSVKAQKSAAEAEEEAERLHQEQLRAEAERRTTGAGGVVGANTTDADEDDDDDEDESEGDSYDEMGKPALIEEAKRRELPHGGSAEKLRERLRAHDAEQSDDDDAEDEGDDDEDDTSGS